MMRADEGFHSDQAGWQVGEFPPMACVSLPCQTWSERPHQEAICRDTDGETHSEPLASQR